MLYDEEYRFVGYNILNVLYTIAIVCCLIVIAILYPRLKDSINSFILYKYKHGNTTLNLYNLKNSIYEEDAVLKELGIKGELSGKSLYNMDLLIEHTDRWIRDLLDKSNIFKDYSGEFSRFTFVGSVLYNDKSDIYIKSKHSGSLWFLIKISINNKKKKIVSNDFEGFYDDWAEPSVLNKKMVSKENAINPYIEIANIKEYKKEVPKGIRKLVNKKHIYNAMNYHDIRYMSYDKKRKSILFKATNLNEGKVKVELNRDFNSMEEIR